MVRVEPLLVQLVKACTRNGRNISQLQVIDLAVEWITDRKIGEELVDWKLIHCSTVAEEFRQTGVRPVPSLGWGWLRGFQTRYPELASLYGGNDKHYRNTWSTYAVLKDNYEMTYEKWVQWGLAKVLPSPQWQDRDGNGVDKDDPT